MLPDGRVYCVPFSDDRARIYDPVNDTTTVANGTFPDFNGFFGGVLLPDGRVYLVPRNATQARIYNPANDTTTVANGTFPGRSLLLAACYCRMGVFTAFRVLLLGQEFTIQ